MDPTKKRLKLWSSKPWLSQVSSFTTFFRSLNLLNNETKVLCVSAGGGHEVMALNNMGVSDVTENALFPLRFSGEMERTVRNGGVCVVVVEECG
ncbi:hypothetical protein DKX38_029912 [Salix brachista]|uniref:Uncharacterized protein n=1 Tax=Salix brachista TaxID=2182728 RepID=A0A5N5J4L7_9ROSI|nr:hypothetical protein DKX38_029912 [Salix brachista]